MQSLWSKVESETERFENVLFLLQAYHTSLLQAFLDADNLAANLATFFPAKHPNRAFIDSFCTCQQTLREVANDLLSERFADRTQEPIRARVTKFQQLERLESLRKRLWSRYERDLGRYKDMVEREAKAKTTRTAAEAAANSTYSFVSSLLGSEQTAAHPAAREAPTSEEIRRMKMIVENEYRLYHDTKEHLARELKALAEEPPVFVEPAVAALTLLQSQTLTLGFDLISRVIQNNPDSITSSAKLDALIGQRSSSVEEDLETRMKLVLSHEIDLRDLTLKPVQAESPSPNADGTESGNGSEMRKYLSDDVRGALGVGRERGRLAKEAKSILAEEALTVKQEAPPASEPTADYVSHDGDLRIGKPPIELQRETTVDATAPPSISIPLDELEERAEEEGPTAEAVEELSPAAEDATEEAEPLKHVRALFDFKALEDIELSFRAGESLAVLAINSDGWWEGRNDSGQVGLIPFNLVEGIAPAAAVS